MEPQLGSVWLMMVTQTWGMSRSQKVGAGENQTAGIEGHLMMSGHHQGTFASRARWLDFSFRRISWAVVGKNQGDGKV